MGLDWVLASHLSLSSECDYGLRTVSANVCTISLSDMSSVRPSDLASDVSNRAGQLHGMSVMLAKRWSS
jgi:hypothetical protein